MAQTKVSDDQLRAYLDTGHSQAEAARFFGVSQAAVHQRLRKMRVLTSRVVALERANDVVEDKLTASDRLARVQQIIDSELAYAVKKAGEPGADRTTLVDTILRLAGEVRQQLALQVSISRTLIDLRVVREFQQVVLEIIREVDPDTAQRIVARLKERRALRPGAELVALDNGGSDGFVA